MVKVVSNFQVSLCLFLSFDWLHNVAEVQWYLCMYTGNCGLGSCCWSVVWEDRVWIHLLFVRLSSFFLTCFCLVRWLYVLPDLQMQRRNGTLEDHEYVSTACKGIFAAERRSQIKASADMWQDFSTKENLGLEQHSYCLTKESLFTAKMEGCLI